MHTLNKLKTGDKAQVLGINARGGIKRRFMDIGLVKGTPVTCVAVSPQGDPKAFNIRGAVIAIRNCDSRLVAVRDEYE